MKWRWCHPIFSPHHLDAENRLVWRITTSVLLYYCNMPSSLILCHCLFESCLFKQSRWANSLAWVIGTFHTFQIDRCLNCSRIKNRQRIQKERENTSKNIRFSCSQPTQMGVTACYCAMLWDISAAIISCPGCCVGGLLRHSQHICAQQWLHFLVFFCTWWNCILPFTEANT